MESGVWRPTDKPWSCEETELASFPHIFTNSVCFQNWTMSVNCFRYFHLHLISSKRSSQSAQYINHHCQNHSSQPGEDRGSLFASNGSQIKAPVSQLCFPSWISFWILLSNCEYHSEYQCPIVHIIVNIMVNIIVNIILQLWLGIVAFRNTFPPQWTAFRWIWNKS